MNVNFEVEKTNTGYSAYVTTRQGMVATTGDTVQELKENALEAYNALMEHTGKQQISENDIVLNFDINSFFSLYNINAGIIASRAGINSTLLSQYVTGRKKPSARQKQRILAGIRALGKELSEVEFK